MTTYTLIILAGGRAQRMNGRDKGLLHWQGAPMVAHLARRFPAAEILISANRNRAAYRTYTDRVFSDERSDFTGPLAGIETCLARASHPNQLIIPCDMPALPDDLATQLFGARKSSRDIAVAHDGARLQPLCMALSADEWLDDLRDYLDAGQRSMHGWLADKPVVSVNFGNKAAFVNLNSEADLSNRG